MDLADAVVAVALSLHAFAVAFMCLYGANCYLMVWHHIRHKKAMLARDDDVWSAWNPKDEDLPIVTVQLPLFNEQYVVTRLIETITRLDYPRDRLEIQILDDSTDETTEIARNQAEKYTRQGFDISLHHREDRSGYKAGALKEGNKTARGEFIAIFDADFTPAPDFLRKTLPFFEDPRMSLVQTLWGHLNRNYSLLTIAQSVGLDGSNYVVQSARCWSGVMMQFQGTGGIWRKSAMDDAGGWHADTLTEDLDLSYRAQTRGWKMKFLPQVKCPGEIPSTMSAVKTQQHRWAKGGLQNAFKLIPGILKSDLSGYAKFEASFHLVTYLIHPCLLVLALGWPLHIWLRDVISIQANFTFGFAILSLSLFGPATLFLYAQKELYPDWKRRIYYFLLLIVWATGIAVNNTKAVFEAIFKVESGFVRTPKFRIEKGSDTWVGKTYRTKLNPQVAVEAMIAVYCLWGIVALASIGLEMLDPFVMTFTLGIWLVTLQSLWEPVAARRSLAKAFPQESQTRTVIPK